ncbi:protein nemuri-like [Drosophila navojoa]|nr:protein nemuri-like [Drosophila navojoa]
MSLKCLALCTFVVLLSIGASSARTLQPRPEQQVRQSKDMRIGNGDLAIDGVDDDEKYNAELDEFDEKNIGELNKLIDDLEGWEKESRAAPSGGKRQDKQRVGANKRNGNWRKTARRTIKRGGKRDGSKRGGNKRGGNKRGGNKRGGNKRRGNQRIRNGRRRRAGAQRVQRPRN